MFLRRKAKSVEARLAAFKQQGTALLAEAERDRQNTVDAMKVLADEITRLTAVEQELSNSGLINK